MVIMKNLTLLCLFLLCVFATQAQGLNGSVRASLPMGDADEVYSFGLAAELDYYFEAGDGFLVGPTVGFKYYFVKSDYSDFVDGAAFLPIGGSARFGISEDFWAGADLGYAVGVSEGNDGGFWYEPYIMYGLGGVGIIASYSGISSDGYTFSSVNLGVAFGL